MSTEGQRPRFLVIPEALALDANVSDRALRLWVRLDHYAGDRGSACPSVERLASDLKTSPSAIGRATRELNKAGWLKVTAGATLEYTLVHVKGEEGVA